MLYLAFISELSEWTLQIYIIFVIKANKTYSFRSFEVVFLQHQAESWQFCFIERLFSNSGKFLFKKND